MNLEDVKQDVIGWHEERLGFDLDPVDDLKVVHAQDIEVGDVVFTPGNDYMAALEVTGVEEEYKGEAQVLTFDKHASLQAMKDAGFEDCWVNHYHRSPSLYKARIDSPEPVCVLSPF